MSTYKDSIKQNILRARSFLSEKLGQGILWNVISLAILAFGGIIINVFIAKYKGNAALGVFNQAYAIYIVLAQIGVGGVQYSTLKHISYNQYKPDICAEISMSALLLVALISGVISLIGFFSANLVATFLDSEGVRIALLAVMPGILFFSLNKVLLMVLNGLRHMRAYAVFRALRFILIPIFILAIIFLHFPKEVLAISLTLTEIVLFFSLIVYVKLRLFSLRITRQSFQWFSKHFSFGLKGMFSGILIEMNSRVDILMLGYFSSDAVVGIYSFAAILAEGFSQLPLVLRWNFDPILGEFFSKRQPEKISRLVQKTKKVFYPLMGIISTFAVFVYPLLRNFSVANDKANPQTSLFVFIIIMIGITINARYRPFIGILLQGGRPGTFTIMILTLIISNILLNLLFIPLIGILGAAIATSITYILEALLLAAFARLFFKVKL